jgi:hypothetical protein
MQAVGSTDERYREAGGGLGEKGGAADELGFR